MALESLSSAIARLEAKGFRHSLRARRGALRIIETDETLDPEALQIEEIVRFEGESDPDDEIVIYALNDAGRGARGTYVVTYGTYVDPLDAEMLLRLSRRAARSRM